MSPKSNYFLVYMFLTTSFLFTGSFQEEVPLVKDLKFKLHSGDIMPLIGIGTYQIQGTQLVKDVLDKAFAAGYRSIDSAAFYKNEEDIGKALKELLPKYNLTRQDIFITTKLPPYDHGEKAYSSLEKSLKNLDSGYIDLYLIHWPGAWPPANSTNVNASGLRDESWKQLVKGVKNGLTRNIGVSNYNVRHIRELLANDHGVKPAVNQVLWNPQNYQTELLELCKAEGILLEAYSSLGGSDNKELLENPEVKRIAKKLGKTTAQVLLRWGLQQNLAIIPKARSQKHFEENIDLNFIISDADMKILSNFPQKRNVGWDPDTVI